MRTSVKGITNIYYMVVTCTLVRGLTKYLLHGSYRTSMRGKTEYLLHGSYAYIGERYNRRFITLYYRVITSNLLGWLFIVVIYICFN